MCRCEDNCCFTKSDCNNKEENNMKSYFIKVLCIPKPGNDEDGYSYEIGNINSSEELMEKKLEILAGKLDDQFYTHISTYEITETSHLALIRKRTVRMM